MANENKRLGDGRSVVIPPGIRARNRTMVLGTSPANAMRAQAERTAPTQPSLRSEEVPKPQRHRVGEKQEEPSSTAASVFPPEEGFVSPLSALDDHLAPLDEIFGRPHEHLPQYSQTPSQEKVVQSTSSTGIAAVSEELEPPAEHARNNVGSVSDNVGSVLDNVGSVLDNVDSVLDNVGNVLDNVGSVFDGFDFNEVISEEIPETGSQGAEGAAAVDAETGLDHKMMQEQPILLPLEEDLAVYEVTGVPVDRNAIGSTDGLTIDDLGTDNLSTDSLSTDSLSTRELGSHPTAPPRIVRGGGLRPPAASAPHVDSEVAPRERCIEREEVATKKPQDSGTKSFGGRPMESAHEEIFWNTETPLVGFLISYDHNPMGSYVELHSGRLVVSRNKEESGNCLVIRDESVSPMHAIMRVSGSGVVQVLDQLSESGTRVKHAGQRDEEFLSGDKTTLSHGDIVFFGDRKFHVLLVNEAQE